MLETWPRPSSEPRGPGRADDRASSTKARGRAGQHTSSPPGPSPALQRRKGGDTGCSPQCKGWRVWTGIHCIYLLKTAPEGSLSSVPGRPSSSAHKPQAQEPCLPAPAPAKPPSSASAAGAQGKAQGRGRSVIFLPEQFLCQRPDSVHRLLLQS